HGPGPGRRRRGRRLHEPARARARLRRTDRQAPSPRHARRARLPRDGLRRLGGDHPRGAVRALPARGRGGAPHSAPRHPPRLRDVFARWGHREIVTPTFEFAEVLAMGTDVGVQESMFKFVDRETGRMLALRADITPQIARVVATRLRDEPKPVRLAYVTNVFR